MEKKEEGAKPPVIAEYELEKQKREHWSADRALNSKGFVEFLTRFPNSEEITRDEDELKEKFEDFQLAGEVEEKLMKVAAAEAEALFGLRLDRKDIGKISQLIEVQATENPQFLREFKDTLSVYIELPQAIQAAERTIANLGVDGAETAAEIEALAEKRKTLMGALETTKWFTPSGKISRWSVTLTASLWGPLMGAMRFYHQGLRSLESGSGENDPENIKELRRFINAPLEVRDKVYEDYGVRLTHSALRTELDKIDREIAKLSRSREQAGLLEEFKRNAVYEVARLRRNLFEGVPPMRQVADLLKKKAQSKLRSLMNPNDKEGFDPEAAQEYFEKMQRASRLGGIEFFKSRSEEKLEKELNKMAEVEVTRQMTEVIKKVPAGQGLLDRLTRELESYLTKEKLGSREGIEAREFIKETLRSISDSLGDDLESRAKRLIVKRITMTLT